MGEGLIGETLVHLSVAASTNDVAKHLAETGCREGTAVLADFQTSGRGRLGRKWDAPARSSLLLSVVFRPNLAPAELQWLTMLCGLAVVDAVRSETGITAGLKWPNDVVYNGAKLGGVLAEATVRGERVDSCIIGLGLNLNLDPHHLPPGLAMPATSLSNELGRPVSLASLLERLLCAVEGRYAALSQGQTPWSEWAEHLETLGKAVNISSGGGQQSGFAVGVDQDGALRVRLSDGRLTRVVAEDVSLRGELGWRQPGRSAIMRLDRAE